MGSVLKQFCFSLFYYCTSFFIAKAFADTIDADNFWQKSSEIALTFNKLISTSSRIQTCSLVFVTPANASDTILLRKLSDYPVVLTSYVVHEKVNLEQSYKPQIDFVLERRHCKVVIVELPSPNSNFHKVGSQILFKFFQNLNHVISMTEDYFIVYSKDNSKSLDLILSEGPVAEKVKHKIGVRFNRNSDIDKLAKPEFFTTCVFCHGNRLKHLENFGNEIFTDMLQNFYGKAIRISTIMSTKVLIDIRPNPDGTWRAVRGVSKFTIEHLMRKFNFTGQYLPASRGGGPGILLPNGTWLGEAGDILEGRAELGVLIFQSFLRNQYVSFTVPVKYVNVMFVSGEPQREYSWRSIYWPLDSLVWYLVFVTFFATFLALRLLIQTDVCSKNSLKKCSHSPPAYYLFTTLMSQDGTELDRKHSTRILVTCWLIFGIIVNTAYCSKLVSLLSFPILESTPKTWKELSETNPNEYKVNLQYNKGAVFTIFKTTTNPTFLKILPRIYLEEDVMKCFQGSIDSSRYVCICIDLIVDYIVKRNLSDKSGNVPMVAAPDKLNFYSMALVVQKGALFLDNFNSILQTGAGMGLPEKWSRIDDQIIRKERRDWERMEGKTMISYEDQSEQSPLKLQNYLGTFYILICGTFGLH